MSKPEVIDTAGDRENAQREQFAAGLAAAQKQLPEGWRILSVRSADPTGATVLVRVPA